MSGCNLQAPFIANESFHKSALRRINFRKNWSVLATGLAPDQVK